MTSLADRTIAAIRSTHDETAAAVNELSDDLLAGRSGAAEWSVAQVLSHLGSGAEISLATLQAATGDGPPVPDDFNQGVWARWNAMSAAQQRDGFLEHDATLVAALEALTAEQRESTQVKLGFMPAPLPFSGYAGMRLNEAAAHGWDVRVGIDPAAAISSGSASVLAEQFAGDLGFLLGFVGKADQLAEPATVDIAGSGFALVIADGVSVTAPTAQPTAQPTATFTGPLEAAIRLTVGRLSPQYTPDTVTVTGNVTLEELRRVFPGF